MWMTKNECLTFAWISSSLAIYLNFWPNRRRSVQLCYVLKISGPWKPNKIRLRQRKQIREQRWIPHVKGMKREGKETPNRIPAAIKYLLQLRKSITFETSFQFFNAFNLNFLTQTTHLSISFFCFSFWHQFPVYKKLMPCKK